MSDEHPTRYWRVTFDEAGAITSVEPLDGADHERSIVVQARDESEARQRAFRIHCSRYARERSAALRAEGLCPCGRRIADPAREIRCPFCVERCERKPPKSPRDGSAANRLALLLEVRTQWLDSPNVGRFSQWLAREIEALAGKGAA